jgi:ABC-2 type transport system ATP-binding protein
MEAIRTEALTKFYRVGFWRPRPYVALDRLSLNVDAGEVFGFLGPNGAGKTTTLKLLMQLTRPTSGRAEILGRPVGDVEVKRRIGYLQENPYFYDYLTAEELLDYFAGLFGYRASDRRRRTSQLLDEVGIHAERRLQLRKFSKGMLQRVGIAQALINNPEVVFLDEPMSGLDPIGRREIRELILALRDRGCTVFFSSHVLSDAEALCSRVAILVGGRLAAEGQLSDLLAHQVRGWEVVIAGATMNVLERMQARGDIERVLSIGDNRFSVRVPGAVGVEPVLSALIGQRVQVVSVTPLKDSLEDLFVRKVAELPKERGLEVVQPCE